VKRSRTDLSCTLGPLTLVNPVCTAAGVAGHGMELAAFGDLKALGAHVVKSLAPFPYEGNRAPRVAPTPAGMINSVGLPGPGVCEWMKTHLVTLRSWGVRPGVSLWGRSEADYVEAAVMLAEVSRDLRFIELNLSCPNTESGMDLFAHNPGISAAITSQVVGHTSLPVFVKISANTERYISVAEAVISAGATGIVAVNTLAANYYGAKFTPLLGTLTGGGLSGRAIFPIALRVIAELRRALPGTPLVGVGGIATGWDALCMMAAGADCIQVGTALFVDPRRPWRIVEEMDEQLTRGGYSSLSQYVAESRGSSL